MDIYEEELNDENGLEDEEEQEDIFEIENKEIKLSCSSCTWVGVEVECGKDSNDNLLCPVCGNRIEIEQEE